MDYSVHMQARCEYERRVGSLRPVPEFGQHVIEHKSIRQQSSIMWLRPILTALLHLVVR